MIDDSKNVNLSRVCVVLKGALIKASIGKDLNKNINLYNKQLLLKKSCQTLSKTKNNIKTLNYYGTYFSCECIFFLFCRIVPHSPR